MNGKSAESAVDTRKIYVLEYSSVLERLENGREHTHIDRARALCVGDNEIIETEGADALGALFVRMTNAGARYVFVWDMAFFGGFCIYTALKNGLKEFKEADKKKTRAGIPVMTESCYSALYTASQGLTNFRLTLPRTGKTHKSGSGKMGAMRTVEYRGLSELFGGHTPQAEAYEQLHITGGGCEALRALFLRWCEAYEQTTGENFLTLGVLRKVYTIGGAAKRLYLRMRYGSASVSKYHKEHFADAEADDYLRVRGLLIGGLCGYPRRIEGKLIEKDLTKYDVNGLYSYTADEVGELGYPSESSFAEFRGDKSGKNVYIIILRSALFVLKKDYPEIFFDPFSKLLTPVIEVEQPWALFGELFDILQKYYTFEDFDIVRVLKCEKRADPVMRQYNDKFRAQKIAAKEGGNECLYLIAKLFLNSLLGKFVQNTRYVERLAVFDHTDDCVTFERGQVKDNWEHGHFDFIRGAYIYAMAKVKVMQDILKLTEGQEDRAAHHFYTDTDSIITDLKLPWDMVDDAASGKYKVERRLKAFGVIARKTYYEYTGDGVHRVTAAGITRGSVVKQVKGAEHMSAGEFWAELTSGRDFYAPYSEYISGGVKRIKIPVKVGKIDIYKIL